MSLLTLLVAELASTKSLGPVMAIGVAVGLCAMITLLPALLVIFGRWVFWPRRSRARVGRADRARRGRGSGSAWPAAPGRLDGDRPGPQRHGAGDDPAGRQRPAEQGLVPDQARGGDRRVRPGPPLPAGAGNPVQVVGRAEAASQLQTALSGTAGVTNVTRPVVRDGYAYLEGTLTSAPDSQAGYGTVDRLRASVHAIAGAEAKVGGGSAVNLDIQRATRHDRNLVVPLVLVVVLVILALVLRAIVSPLLLVATVVLSFAAALGVSALVFDHVFGLRRRRPRSRCGPLCSWSPWAPTTTSSS